MMFGKHDYVVRSGSSVIAVRKNWGAAQDSVDAYIRELSRTGFKYTRTRAQTHKDAQGKSMHAQYHYAADHVGGLLILTINRGS